MSEKRNNVIMFRPRPANSSTLASEPGATAFVTPTNDIIYYCSLEYVDAEGNLEKVSWSMEPLPGRLWEVAKSIQVDGPDGDFDYLTERFGPFPLDEACLLMERNDAGKASEIREIVKGREKP
jgi:hypothetical protein